MKTGVAMFGLFATVQCFNIPAMSSSGDRVHIKFGGSGRKGHPAFVRDAYTMHNSDEQLLVTLCDHAASEAAHVCADRLQKYMMKCDKEELVFAQFHEETRASHADSGIAAVTARITPQKNGSRRLQFAWTGDYRALLMNKNGILLAQTNSDKPKKKLRSQSCPDLAHSIQSPIHKRLSLKHMPNRAACSISPIPEIISYPLHPEFEGFIILANSGVWDVVSGEAATNYVLHAKNFFEKMNDVELSNFVDDSDACNIDGALTHEGGSDERAILLARGLRDLAYHEGSFDNITAVVISLSRDSKKSEVLPPISKPESTNSQSAICSIL